MTVVSFADARVDLRFPIVYIEGVGSQMAEHYSTLIEDFSLTRRRVKRAKTFGKALEHYARGLRRYYQFKGVLSLASHFDHPRFKPLIPARLMGEIFVCQSQASLIETFLTRPDPWQSAAGLSTFRNAADCTMHIAVMLAEEGRRASLVLAGESPNLFDPEDETPKPPCAA